MAESDGVAHQMQLSLQELSLELQSLGLKPLMKSISSKEEICEALLGTAWTLINLVHGTAMGLCSGNSNSTNKELLLRVQLQALESKLEQLKKESSLKDNVISKEKANILKMNLDLKKQSTTIKKQTHTISQLTAAIESLEKDLKHEVSKQETRNEYLRDMIRKSIGIRSNTISVDTVGNVLQSMSVSGFSEQAELQQATINRLKSTNQILVGENLMLRNSLNMIHSDISFILQAASPTGPPDENPAFPVSIFRLPLSCSMKKIQDIRQQQINQLKILLKCTQE